MAAQLREFTLWLTALTGFLFAVIKAVQWFMGVVGVRVGREVTSFESILRAQDALLTDCRKTVEEMRTSERQREQDVLARLAAKDTILQQERKTYDASRDEFYRQLAVAHQRVFECEGILRRHGWHDARAEPRGQKEA
jgi:hypothetical protein